MALDTIRYSCDVLFVNIQILVCKGNSGQSQQTNKYIRLLSSGSEMFWNIPKYPKPDSCFGYFLGCLRTTKKSIFWKAFDPSTDSKSRRVWAIWITLRPFSPWLHVYCLWLSLPVDMRQIWLSCQLNGGLSGRHQICKNRQRIFFCFFHRLVLEQWAICLLCYLGGWGSKIFCSWCRAVAR